MYKVAICDDEEQVRIQLREYMERLVEEEGSKAAVHVYDSGEDFIERYDGAYDIIFLDIKMYDLDGIEAARRIRKFNKEVCIIFISSMVQYALDCFKVRAFGFLKKPLTYEEFRMEVKEALSNITDDKNGKEIAVKTGRGTKWVQTHRIRYAEVQNHEIILHMGVAEIRFYGKLKEMEEQLKDCSFLRCHSSFLVNCIHIQEVRPLSLLLDNGEEIPISKHRKKEFMEELTRYAGGRL
ncbi:MAG: response regulator transcription factor [Clostridiaceae bacterium]|nr:response regulator transcription factor [Clostridiaceae bacterium]